MSRVVMNCVVQKQGNATDTHDLDANVNEDTGLLSWLETPLATGTNLLDKLESPPVTALIDPFRVAACELSNMTTAKIHLKSHTSNCILCFIIIDNIQTDGPIMNFVVPSCPMQFGLVSWNETVCVLPTTNLAKFVLLKAGCVVVVSHLVAGSCAWNTQSPCCLVLSARQWLQPACLGIQPPEFVLLLWVQHRLIARHLEGCGWEVSMHCETDQQDQSVLSNFVWKQTQWPCFSPRVLNIWAEAVCLKLQTLQSELSWAPGHIPATLPLVASHNEMETSLTQC